MLTNLHATAASQTVSVKRIAGVSDILVITALCGWVGL